MKNKIFIIIISTIFGLIEISCDDLLSLEEKPYTFISAEQFFRNEADAEAAVGAALQAFQSLNYYQRGYPLGVFLTSDIGAGRGHYQPLGEMNLDQTTGNNYIWGPYNSMYIGINRANLGLEKIPDIDMPEIRKNVLLGQLHFIRALCYVHLVRYWGEVPLRLNSSKGYYELSKPRATVQEVYDQIIKDLKLAESLLSDVDVNGRPTKWAAKTLLADVYLGIEEWSLASAKAKEVIDSKRYSLVEVKVSDDFDKIFGPEKQPSVEEIFNIPFIRQVPYGMHHPAVFAHPNAGYAALGFRGVWLTMKSPFLLNWDKNDLRYDFNLYVGHDTIYLSRLEPQRPKKFKDPLAADRLGHGNDYPVLRFPDALLIFAESEAISKGTPTPEAYNAVNQVRRRAYGLPLDTPAPDIDIPPNLSVNEFRDKIIDERSWEFLVESKRLWDLKRTGKYEQAIKIAGKNWDPKWLLWPLPQAELDANEALTLDDQNPGW